MSANSIPALPESDPLFKYISSKLGTDLRAGDIIIANSQYATVEYVSLDHIHTSAGKRMFYPNHHYPVFVRIQASSSESEL